MYVYIFLYLNELFFVNFSINLRQQSIQNMESLFLPIQKQNDFSFPMYFDKTKNTIFREWQHKQVFDGENKLSGFSGWHYYKVGWRTVSMEKSEFS